MSRNILAVGNSGQNFVDSLNSNFLQLYNNSVVNAKDYGFLPTASASDNVIALQAALLYGNKTLYINTGTYELNDTVLIDSNTHICCELGVKFKKVATYSHILLNRGALTKTYDNNIIIDGLEILSNGYDLTTSPFAFGLYSEIQFYYAKNISIVNFKHLDGTYLYSIGVCRWENLIINNFYVKSNGGDAVSLHTGHGAVVSNGILETRDDGVTVKTIDYPYVCTEIDDTYNVTFRNIIDRTPSGQTLLGYGCRVMTSSWADWTNGNTYITGDICLNEGKIYQSNNSLNFSATGSVAPTHTSGTVTGADGIAWVYKNDSTKYHADVWNVTFDNWSCEKDRPILSVEINYDTGILRSAYPGTESLSKAYNITITNSFVKSTLGNVFIITQGNLGYISIQNTVLEGVAVIFYADDSREYENYLHASFIGNIIKDTDLSILSSGMHNSVIDIVTSGNKVINSDIGVGLWNADSLRITGTDITYNTGTLAKLSPEIGDMVRDVDGVWIYKSGGWVNLAV